ncbi:ABC transporter substrate-binding protein [Brevibacillus reuszeri]|uniref:ABC transporter substrate-binding protein n=1 Tax=Brevibacillus reuszeri TaxID=54915 RepID=UPI003D1C626D
MKKRSMTQIASTLLVCASLLVSACSGNTGNPSPEKTTPEQSASAERVLTDAMGNKVTLPAHPQKVIATYLEDHLIALGVKPVAQWSVGEGSVQGYLQKELAGIPAIPYDLPPEVVMSYSPDLILLESADLAVGEKYNQYAKIAPTYTIGVEKNTDWRKELLTVGEVLNKTDEAKAVLAAYEKKAQEAKEKLQQTVGPKTATALWVLPKSVFVVKENLSSGDVLYKDLGFTVPKIVHEVTKASEANWSKISLEKLATLDTDYLFIVNSKEVPMKDLVSDPVYANIPAVKNGHVYEFPKESSWLYSGTIANGQIIDDVLKSVLQ